MTVSKKQDLEQIVLSELQFYGDLVNEQPEIIDITVEDFNETENKPGSFSTSFFLGNQYYGELSQEFIHDEHFGGRLQEKMSFTLKDDNGEIISNQGWYTGAEHLEKNNAKLHFHSRVAFIKQYLRPMELRYNYSWDKSESDSTSFYEPLVKHLIRKGFPKPDQISHDDSLNQLIQDGNVDLLQEFLEKEIAVRGNSHYMRVHMEKEGALMVEAAKERQKLFDESIDIKDKDIFSREFLIDGSTQNEYNILVYEELRSCLDVGFSIIGDLNRSRVFGGSKVYCTSQIDSLVRGGETGQFDAIVIQGGEDFLVLAQNLISKHGEELGLTVNGHEVSEGNSIQAGLLEKKRFHKQIESSLQKRKKRIPTFVYLPGYSYKVNIAEVLAADFGLEDDQKRSKAFETAVRISNTIDSLFPDYTRERSNSVYSSFEVQMHEMEFKTRNASQNLQLFEWENLDEFQDGILAFTRRMFPMRLDDMNPLTLAQQVEQITHQLNEVNDSYSWDTFKYACEKFYSMLEHFIDDPYYAMDEDSQKEYFGIIGSTIVLSQYFNQKSFPFSFTDINFDRNPDNSTPISYQQFVEKTVPRINNMAKRFEQNSLNFSESFTELEKIANNWKADVESREV